MVWTFQPKNNSDGPYDKQNPQERTANPRCSWELLLRCDWRRTMNYVTEWCWKIIVFRIMFLWEAWQPPKSEGFYQQLHVKYFTAILCLSNNLLQRTGELLAKVMKTINLIALLLIQDGSILSLLGQINLICLYSLKHQEWSWNDVLFVCSAFQHS